MKRLHVHVAVDDLDRSIGFYAALFGADPAIRHADYAKWMLDDPCVNFAISSRGRAGGVDHLGIQVESAEELADITARLKAAEEAVMPEANAQCCYAQSDKTWAADPQGVKWESFLTHGQITTYGRGPDFAEIETPATASACCAPKVEAAPAPRAAACCA